jgi:hypothetical protein
LGTLQINNIVRRFLALNLSFLCLLIYDESGEFNVLAEGNFAITTEPIFSTDGNSGEDL